MERPIAVIGAMEEEVVLLREHMQIEKEYRQAGLTFFEGTLAGKAVVLVRCGIGKVNAAICTQILADHYKPERIINSGAAGAIAPIADIGDIAISSAALYHDFDTTALGFSVGEIPFMATSRFAADQHLVQLTQNAARQIFGSDKVHTGLIVSGDQFISGAGAKQRISQSFAALCAEMEGAAVAHTAHLNSIPYVVIRVISDKADASAPENFETFLQSVIPRLTQVVEAVLEAC